LGAVPAFPSACRADGSGVSAMRVAPKVKKYQETKTVFFDQCARRKAKGTLLLPAVE